MPRLVIVFFYAIYGLLTAILLLGNGMSSSLWFPAYLVLSISLTSFIVSVGLFFFKNWALTWSYITTALTFVYWCFFLFILWGIGGWPGNLNSWPLFLPGFIFLLINIGANFNIKRLRNEKT